MAYRGNSSNDGGCLATIIAFFVLFFLPAWVAGDDFGWGGTYNMVDYIGIYMLAYI